MKKRLSITLLVLVLTVLSLVCIACGKKKPVVDEQPNAGKEAETENTETELLFSFESYADIAGTRVWLMNHFGATKINKDSTYITEGKASWMLQPQGNYATPNALPYFKLECFETTFTNSDFLAYDKILMDVYNDSEEETTIQWTLGMTDDFDGTSEAPMVTCTLAPKTWTTCEYNLTDEVFGTFFHYDEVKHVKVQFPDFKTSREDSVKTLYVDNLRGHFAEEEGTITGLDFDLSEGITFEQAGDQYLFSTSKLDINNMPMTRVAYKDTALKNVEASLGEYCLVGDATGATWPSFTLNFGKTYDKDMLFSFWVYIEVDPAKVGNATWHPAAQISDVDRTQFNMLTTTSQFNKWVQVYAILPAATSTTWTYFNLDGNIGGVSKAWFDVDEPVTVYMDNFQIGEYKENFTVAADGTVTMKNKYNKKTLSYTFDKPVKAGQIVSFDIDVTPAQAMAVWLLGDDKWEDEHYAWSYATWEGKKTILVEIPKDTNNFSVVVQFREEGRDYSDNVVTLSNVKIMDSMGVSLSNPAGKASVSYTFNKAVKAGQVVKFDIDVKPAQKVAIWLLGNENWNQEYYACSYPSWDGKSTIEVEIPTDIKNFMVFVKFLDESLDHSKNTVEITNVSVGNKEWPNNYNLRTGLTFEDAKDATVIKGGAANNKLKLSRVAYADTTVKAKDASYGNYALMGDGTGATWPAFTIEFDKTYEKGNILSFWLYVEADAEAVADKTFIVESFNATTKKVKNTILSGKGQFNKWMQVNVQLDDASDTAWVYVNLDDGSGKSMLGDANVKVYMDNFRMYQDEEALGTVTKNDDGSITISNQSNRQIVSYVFEQEAKAGQVVSFDVDVTPAQKIAVWMLGDDKWEDEYYARSYDSWDGKQTIMLEVPEDTANFSVVVKFTEEGADYTDNVVTLSNVKVMDRMAVSLSNPNNKASVSYNFNKAVKAGQLLSFEIDVTPAQKMAVWVLGDGSWEKEYYACSYPNWTSQKNILVEIPEDIQNFTVYVKFTAEGADYSDNVVTIQNIQVQDGAIELPNSNNAKVVRCDIGGTFTAGSTFTFDFNFAQSEDAVVWILGNGDWAQQYYAKNATWNGKQTISVELPINLAYVQVYIQYQTADGTYTDNLPTISNIQIGDSLKLQNSTNSRVIKYEVGGKLAAGTTLSFDVAFATSENAGIWVLGNGSWNRQYYAKSTTWSGQRRIAVELPVACEYVLIYIQYQTVDGTYTDNLPTISDIQIEDGTQIKNSANTQRVAFDLGGTFTAGSTLSFDIDFNVKEDVTIWVSGKSEYLAWASTWTDKEKIVVELPQTLEYISVLIQYNSGGTYSDKIATISNIQVGNSFAMQNTGNAQAIDFYVGKLTSGSTLSFDAEFKSNERIVIWVLGDSSWGKEYICVDKSAWSGKQTVNVPISADASHARVIIKYMNADGTYTDNLPTISNIQIQ